ncbi:MAG: hypothetical protein IJJ61_08800 [Clostridia bacterium]|nr:hypothetical protein [Clostridia bacterium]
MNTDQLLNQIDDIIESGSKTLRGGKVAVDAEAIRTTIDEIRAGLPKEISQAKLIVVDRNNILAKAKTESVNVVTEAQEKSRALVSAAEDRVRTLVLKTEDYCKNKVTEAEAQAGKIISDAEGEAAQIREGARTEAAALVDDSVIVIEAKEKADNLLAVSAEHAKNTVDEAEKKAKAIIDAANAQFENITGQAEIDAAASVEKANNWSSEIRSSATDFVDDILNKADEAVAQSLRELQDARNKIRALTTQEAQDNLTD